MNVLLRGCALIFLFCSLGQAQWGPERRPASAHDISYQHNEKSIVSCLAKLKGMITPEDTSNLDLLKTKIERVYGYQRSLVEYRELIYKNQSEEKWKVQFTLMNGSLWGKEKYKFKFFKVKEAGAWVEQPAPLKEDSFTKDAFLKFAQDQSIEMDERWEHLVIPGNPYFKFKTRNFKVMELSLAIAPPISVPNKSTLSCTLTGIQPFCLCTH